MLEHSLTDAQIQIYDAYAGAFGIIHNNLDAALQAAGVTGATGTLNGAAKFRCTVGLRIGQAAVLQPSGSRR